MNANITLDPQTEPADGVSFSFDDLLESTVLQQETAGEQTAESEEFEQDRLSEPTLFVGVGGTGIKACTLLKAAFVESHGKMPGNAAILCLDSADDPVSYRENRSGAIVTLEPRSEFFLFDKVPVSGIKRHPQRHPELLDRLGRDNLDKINRAFIAHGAAAQRPQGLMSFVWNAKGVEEKLENTLHRLTGRTRDLRYELEGKTSLKVFIIGSIAGGQGSGSILDVAYIIREKLMALGNLGESSSVVAALLLPGAFHEISTLQMQANASAFVEELNGLMLSRLSFEATYPGGTHILSSEPPFDQVYIFDGVDENGKSWASQDEVCGLIARTSWLLASSEVGAREINSMINESGVLLGESEEGYGSFAGTAGQAVIRWPAREVAERCALRHAVAMLEHLQARLAEMQPDAVGEAAVDLATLREQLSSNRDGIPHQVRLAAPAALEQMPVDDVPGQARNLVDNYMQRRLYDEYYVEMTTKAHRLRTQLLQELETRLQGMLDAGRLAGALAWLQPTLQATEKLRGTIAAEQERTGRQVEQKQAALESAATAMDRASSGIAALLPFVGRNQMQGAVNTYLEEAGALARLRLTQRAEELVADVTHAVIDWLQQHVRTLEVIAARLHQTGEWLLARETAFTRRGGSHSEISLAEPALIDHFYGQYAGNVPADTQLAIAQSTGLLSWAEQRPAAVAHQLMESAFASFAPVLRLTVEDVLALRWTDRSALQWVERLRELAAGAWNLDQSLLKSGGVGLASFLTIGVPDEATSIFADCGHSLVSTHDAERVIALRTVYGASFDTLKPFPYWRRAYEKLAPRVPLHTLHQYHRTQERTAQIFALGIIFEHVYNAVTWYYYRPQDPLSESIRLDQGLENAFHAFAEMHELQDELIGRVEAQIAADGIAQSVETIQAWIHRGNSSDGTLTRLRRAAREYLADLQVGQIATRQNEGRQD